MGAAIMEWFCPGGGIVRAGSRGSLEFGVTCEQDGELHERRFSISHLEIKKVR